MPKWKRGGYRKNGTRNFPRGKAKNMQILDTTRGEGKSLLHCPWRRSEAKVNSAALVSFLYCTLLHSAEKASCFSVGTAGILFIYQAVNILCSSTYVCSRSFKYGSFFEKHCALVSLPSVRFTQEVLCFRTVENDIFFGTVSSY